MNTISVVITDLDNTLFDWVEIWHRPFKAMLDRLVSDSGVPEERLIDEIQAIYARHGTTEYAFVIEEIPSLQQKHPNSDLSQIYADAIHAFRSERKRVLQFYPTVADTLSALKSRGCLLVGYTESQAFYTHFRMRTLGLDETLDYIYSPPDHELPGGKTAAEIRMYDPEHYELKRTLKRHTPPGEKKPNPEILLQIIRDVGASPNDVIYVGDNLIKDVLMAQRAGVTEVWAKYGQAHQREEYELLRRVTHWSTAEVEREKALTFEDVNPRFLLHEAFSELLDLFTFGPFTRHARSSGSESGEP